MHMDIMHMYVKWKSIVVENGMTNWCKSIHICLETGKGPDDKSQFEDGRNIIKVVIDYSVLHSSISE